MGYAQYTHLNIERNEMMVFRTNIIYAKFNVLLPPDCKPEHAPLVLVKTSWTYSKGLPVLFVIIFVSCIKYMNYFCNVM